MLRFAIRDILWLTVVVGLAVGWYSQTHYLDNRNRVLERHTSYLKKNLEGFNLSVILKDDGVEIRNAGKRVEIMAVPITESPLSQNNGS
jgi:hypothetical protein